jgi:hypothetical protein
MTRKQWIVTASVLVLGGLSLYFNTDWFLKENIQIYHRARPVRAALTGRKRARNLTYTPVFFGFDRKLKLTEIKVVPVSETITNKYPHPIWHMITDSNSVPTKGFLYGENVPGMRPAVKGAIPDPLEPGTNYRLLVQAGSLKVQHDFATTGPTP